MSTKEGCQGVSVAMPREMAIALSRLPPYNRTLHINRAVATYLEVQGPATNAHGVDCRYFREKMGALMRDIGSYTGSELARAFANMASTAAHNNRVYGVPCERESINEEV